MRQRLTKRLPVPAAPRVPDDDLFFLPVGLRGLIGLAMGIVTKLQRMGHRGPGSQEHPEEVERTESLQSQPLMRAARVTAAWRRRALSVR